MECDSETSDQSTNVESESTTTTDKSVETSSDSSSAKKRLKVNDDTTILYRSGTPSSDEIYRCLKSVDRSKLSETPPRVIQNGDNYVYEVRPTDPNFWRFDRHDFRYLRTDVHPKPRPKTDKDKKPVLLHRTEFQLFSNQAAVAFYRHENVLADSTEGENIFVFVKYYGPFDMRNYVHKPVAHGNKKKLKDTARVKKVKDLKQIHPKGSTPVKAYEREENVTPQKTDKEVEQEQAQSSDDEFVTQPYTPTSKQVRKQLRIKAAEGKGGLLAYSETLAESGSSEVEHQPRNKKQAYNAAYAVKGRRDQVWDVSSFAVEHPGFVRDASFVNGLRVVLCHNSMVEHLRDLYKLANQQNRYLVFHYDTTYNIGPYFVTLLSFRHFLFAEDPVVLVAAYLHSHTDTSDHLSLFRMLKDAIPEFNSGRSVIVTDREGSIRNAISRKLKKTTHFYCWNHLRQNVGHWAESHCPIAEVGKIKNDIINLLSAESLQQYDNMIKEARTRWPENFCEYYEKFVDEDVKTSARWVLEGFNLFNSISGITNNPAESANKTIKTILEHQRADMYKLTLAVYLHQTRFLVDIKRGLQLQGEFRLKKAVANQVGFFKTLDVHDIIDPTTIASCVLDGKIPADLAKYPERQLTKWDSEVEGLAELLVQKERVSFVPGAKCFAVVGLNNTKQLVDLEKRSCSCNKQKMCEHFLAVMKNIGLPNLASTLFQNKTQNLQSLYLATKPNRTGRKGKGVPRTSLARIISGSQSKSLLTTHSEKPGSAVPDDPDGDNIQQVSTNAAGDLAEQSDSTELGKKSSESTDQFVQVPIPGGPRSQEMSSSHETAGAKGKTGKMFSFKKPDIPKSKTILLQEPAIVHGLIASLVEKQMDELPELTSVNQDYPVLHFPRGTMHFIELKSIPVTLRRSEYGFLNKRSKTGAQKYSSSEAGWLMDTIIDAFIYETTHHLPNVVCLTTGEVEVMKKTKINTELPKTTDYFAIQRNIEWDQCEKMFMPYNVRNTHWQLIALFPQKKEYYVADPIIGATELPRELHSWLFEKIDKSCSGRVTEWVKLEPRLPLQSDGTNCGVFLLYYVFFAARGINIPLTTIDTDLLRRKILGTIMGNCQLHLSKDKRGLKTCPACRKTEDVNISCLRCGQSYHAACTDPGDGKNFRCPGPRK